MNTNRIKIDHLRYFIAAAETGKFSTAGELLNISPTSIAHGISSLEAYLGCELLLRRRAQGVIPSRHGRDFLVAARDVVLEIENLATSFKINPDHLTGEVIVGCQEELSWSLLPYAITHLRTLHPGLTVTTKSASRENGHQMLDRGEVDLLISLSLCQDIRLDYDHEVLYQPHLYAMMSADHPLMKDRTESTITLSEMAQFDNLTNSDAIYRLMRSAYADIAPTHPIKLENCASSYLQCIAGVSSKISFTCTKTRNNLSPIGDRLAYLEILEDLPRLNITSVTPKMDNKSKNNHAADEILRACKRAFYEKPSADNFSTRAPAKAKPH